MTCNKKPGRRSASPVFLMNLTERLNRRDRQTLYGFCAADGYEA